MFAESMLRMIFGSDREETTEGRREKKLHSE